MTFDASAYNIAIRKVLIDDEVLFEARVRELPDVIEYADSWGEAYELAIDTIETTAAHFSERGKAMPSPIEPVDEYSGRITLRLPRRLHLATAEEAAYEGVSLNQHIVSILAFQAGCSYGCRSAEAEWWSPLVPSGAVGKERKKATNVKVIHLDDYPSRYRPGRVNW